jgi:hypothetical protein
VKLDTIHPDWEYIKGYVKLHLATENTESIDPAPAFGAGGKNSKISVISVAYTLISPLHPDL